MLLGATGRGPEKEWSRLRSGDVFGRTPYPAIESVNRCAPSGIDSSTFHRSPVVSNELNWDWQLVAYGSFPWIRPA